MLWTVAGLMTTLLVASMIFRVHFAGWSTVAALPWWFAGPLLAAIQRRPKIRRAAIEASAEGLRVGGELVPRARLTSALLRRERDKTWVALRGKRAFGRASVDVEVASDDEADRLCRALALDAASTTAEFSLFRVEPRPDKRVLVIFGALLAALAFVPVALGSALPGAAFLTVLAPAVLVALAVGIFLFQQRARLRVGADGLVVREGLRGKRFISHDEIEGVRAAGSTVVIARKRGGELVYSTSGTDRSKNNGPEWERHAQSVAWRIDKAREAFRALAGDAPQAALVLDRGERTAREWLEQLRRVGAGATATFRGVALTREQLLRIVESTTAAARARLAAAAALHDGLTEEEKPRVRVAAERSAEPAFRERMVRVAFAPSDEELEAALAEEAELSEDGAGAHRAS